MRRAGFWILLCVGLVALGLGIWYVPDRATLEGQNAILVALGIAFVAVAFMLR
jgi:hypothetical protein